MDLLFLCIQRPPKGTPWEVLVCLHAYFVQEEDDRGFKPVPVRSSKSVVFCFFARGYGFLVLLILVRSCFRYVTLLRGLKPKIPVWRTFTLTPDPCLTPRQSLGRMLLGEQQIVRGQDGHEQI